MTGHTISDLMPILSASDLNGTVSSAISLFSQSETKGCRFYHLPCSRWSTRFGTCGASHKFILYSKAFTTSKILT